MNIVAQDVVDAQEAREAIEDALDTLKQIAGRSNNRARFESYITGAIEQACENFTGFGNYSINDFIKDLEEEIEEQE